MKGHDRYRFGVRVIAAIELEGANLHADELVHERRALLLQSINSQADQIKLIPGMGFAGNIASLIGILEQTLAAEADQALSLCLQNVLVTLQARRNSRSCALCSDRPADLPVCAELFELRSTENPQICIDEVASLLFTMKDRSRAVYLRHTPRADEISVKFSLQRVEAGVQQGYIPDFHIDGSTDVNGDFSVIEIVLEDGALNLETLRQVSYVCAHELVCHAYQGIDSQERKNANATCSWSEGWMDAIAWRLLERWLQAEKESPPLPHWLARSPGKALRDCRKLHERRYLERQGRSMKPFNVYRRMQARDACDELYRQWSAPQEKRTFNGLRKVVEFSVALNIARLDRKQREDIVLELSGGLLANAPLRLDRTVIACDEFLRHRDPARLLKTLLSERNYLSVVE